MGGGGDSDVADWPSHGRRVYKKKRATARRLTPFRTWPDHDWNYLPSESILESPKNLRFGINMDLATEQLVLCDVSYC